MIVISNHHFGMRTFRTDKLTSTCFHFQVWHRYIYANCIKPKQGRITDAAPWQKLLECFDHLANGLDEDGEPIYIDAQGRRWNFVLLFGVGDMEQLCYGWGLKSYNDVGEMCGLCLANRDDRPFTDLQPDANWRTTCPLSNEVT